MKALTKRVLFPAFLILLFTYPASIFAAGITVNSGCSLADAITAANTDTATGGCAAGSGADTITLSAEVTLSAALPDITSEITIEGAGYYISGNDSHQIFDIKANATVTINNLTLKNGSAGNQGGAIHNLGTLTINNSIFSNNRAVNRGGAIANYGQLTVNGSTFNNNRATSKRSDANYGGAIKSWFDASSSITNSTFYGNSARRGGAIHHNDSLTVTNSTFVANVATVDGGATESTRYTYRVRAIRDGKKGKRSNYVNVDR